MKHDDKIFAELLEKLDKMPKDGALAALFALAVFGAVALIFAVMAFVAPALGATIPRAEPIPVYDGLLMYPDHIEGRHAFGPADGIDLWLGKGKGDWPVVAVRTHLRPGRSVTNASYVLSGVAGYRETRRPGFPLPPLCCRHTPPVTADPPATDHPAPVPLPASVWLILAGIGAFIPFARPGRLRHRFR